MVYNVSDLFSRKCRASCPTIRISANYSIEVSTYPVIHVCCKSCMPGLRSSCCFAFVLSSGVQKTNKANGAVSVWDELNEASSAKKAELSKGDGWSRAPGHIGP
ncbi:hypothetical protein F3Y22_tig00109972pilonHSYRG00420 [Hibiscus syriacus]|uniref:Uncharacterized protein n=1 Tax=Hibiscus syriacus TaxID=106335 RepID=A0A6A3BRN3_HIBSY|nr:hypothetical protein F3Y22_tig00109972pilonHSYRG00420 [Hibiscus syriacus]